MIMVNKCQVITEMNNNNNSYYEIKIFDWNLNECKTLINFKYDNKKTLEMIYMNDDTTNKNNEIMLIAVRDKFELVWIQLSNNKNIIQNEMIIKKFSSQIIHLEPQWFFGRVYVLTQESSQEHYSIYEIDLNSKLIVKLHEFKTNSTAIHMTADPFQGTLTYSIENRLHSINIMYISSLAATNNNNNNNDHFQEYPYENILKYNATCKYHGSFDFLLTSSQLNGFSEIQFYYVKTKQGINLKCILVESECNCTPVDENKISAQFNKSNCNNFLNF